jgi:hypothetical protein
MRNKLTPTAVHKTKRVGYHSDGGGLYLRVTRTGTRSWNFGGGAPAGSGTWGSVQSIVRAFARWAPP